jgi:transcriptional regulator with XRE-family HTH domain
MINHLESGIRNPTVIVFHALAAALEIDLAKLMARVLRSDEKSGRGRAHFIPDGSQVSLRRLPSKSPRSAK